MRCPFCGTSKDKVVDSRAADQGRTIRRRRECLGCAKRFTTYEYVEERTRVMVIKKDGTRCPYERQKAFTGLEKSCYKRSVTAEQMTAIIEEVEEELFSRQEREVESLEIGRAIADRLKKVDQVAYVRFASVYKQFRDLDDLLDEVRDVIESTDEGDGVDQGYLFS